MTASRLPKNLTHWQIEENGGTVSLIIDKADSAANTLGEAVISEFAQIVDALSSADGITGLILQSGKAGGFIAGADISEIQNAKDSSALAANIRQVKTLFDRFEALPFTKVCLIDGYCLGGGLELALCCDYRLITERSVLGLPEVKLGLMPGFSGTARLTLLIANPFKSLPLLLQGASLRGQKAISLGAADRCVKTAAELLPLAQSYLQKPRVSPSGSVIFRAAFLRSLAANLIRKRLAAKAKPEHYPAPFAILELWQKHGGSYRAMSEAETEAFVRLRATPQSENLIRLYFLQERLKSFGKNDAPAIQHLHVIGAGVMGSGIAAWSALNGIYTSLGDLSSKALDKALADAQKMFRKKRRGDAADEAALRLRPDNTGWGLDKADLIIEAAVEKLEAKQAIFQNAAAAAKPSALLATNTSSLKLEDIASALAQPNRLIGIHFFNPVAQMPLVEIVRQADTPQSDLDRAAKYVTQINRLPLPVKSSPGFLVNRILVPYLFEALLIYREGIDAASIDKAAEDFGMPMGPIELADNVGLDVCAHILASMGDVLKVDSLEIPELTDRINANKLGRKSGEGFYTFQNGKAQKESAKLDSAALSPIAERLIMAYLNACAWCLREGIVADADLLDAGCVFGTGFAPFRGGPLHYAKTLGIPYIQDTLKRLQAAYGERFAPDAYWQNA